MTASSDLTPEREVTASSDLTPERKVTASSDLTPKREVTASSDLTPEREIQHTCKYRSARKHLRSASLGASLGRPRLQP